MKSYYDVIVVGGGTAGVATAYMAAKLGLHVLLVEKNIHLGGTITSGLVIPAMKTNDLGINSTFFNDLIEFANSYGAQYTYIDGNKGWFNPELLKIVLDKMLNYVGVDIYLATSFNKAKEKNGRFVLHFSQEMLSLHSETKYLVDATSNGKIFQSLNCEFLNKDKNENQAITLRFTMAGVNLKDFSDWIMKFDSDRNVTTCVADIQIHLSTAYTWDTNINWALRPLFTKAVEDGVLREEDTAYFQLFTIPGMPSSIAFNCPRIQINDCEENYLSKAAIKGREQIFRLAEFCKIYLKGFENAYISNIADMLGIRESNRVKGKHIYTEFELLDKKKFDNVALSSDYPIDIHSIKKDDSTLHFTKGNYFLPIESLISDKYDNLFIAGRALSATFKAQAALRVQTCCFAMGEAIAKYIKQKET
ncbi:MAG: FAD-dependent oxidoreductase [Candidatus Gastranaerophilales bacterium]|nr:FAD-dependent oxidoreductase [Candidatus Gastranaerophilales bacterium]